ncbi:MAG: leucyl aminopeptidase family protein, partial [Chlamydiales bacterium]
MHQLEFTHKMERADCLVVCDVTHPHLREVRDMIEANIAIGQTLITTNGAFLIPRLWVSQEIENIPPGKIALLGYKEELLFHLLQIRDVVVICDNPLEASHQFACKKALLEGIFLAKELTNAPANQMTPAIFARRCLELQKWGIAVEILPPTPLLQAVGKGSSNPPQLVVMQLNKGKEPIALVGKGVCYDAGGIALKREFLSQMKWDKAGAAAVVGTMKTLALQKCPQHVVAVVALAENMPDGAALKPGDVIRSLSGKTVEVIDPDGEGRLILADSITYVQERFQPKIVIDLATLTLETFGALAGEFGGLFCNDRELAQKLIQSG